MINWIKEKLKKLWVWLIMGGIVLAAGSQVILPEPIPEHLQLKAPKEKILFSREVDDIEFNMETGEVINRGKITSYLYISDIEVPLEENEIRRTKNAQIFLKGINIKGEQKYTGRFFVGEPFYKDKVQNKWFLTESGTTTPEMFDRQMKPSLFEIFLKQIVYADDAIFYSGSGDGDIRNQETGINQATWDITHDAVIGDALVNDTYLRITSSIVSGLTQVHRSFLPIDTSAIPSGSTVNSATATITSSINLSSGTQTFALVGNTSSSTDAVYLEDYDQAGSINNPDEGATRITIDSTGVYSWTLNATGTSWIKTSGDTSTCGVGDSTTGWTCLGIRSGWLDCDDVRPTDGSQEAQLYIRSSDQTGTSSDPYLTIDWTAAAARRIIIIE